MDKHLEKLGRAVRVEGEISIARGLEGGGGEGGGRVPPRSIYFLVS